MSTTMLRFTHTVNGALTDATAVLLSDPTGAFGLRRTDTNAVIVADSTAFTRDSVGSYSYAFADPAPGLTYEYWIEWVFGGATDRIQKFSSAAPENGAYLGVAAARALAATLPGVAALVALTDDALAAALLLASINLDARRIQGRKFDPTQDRAFPRLAYGAMLVRPLDFIATPAGQIAQPFGPQTIVWDWDPDTNLPVVPTNVLIACLYQANYMAGQPKLLARLEAIRSGLAAQAVGTGSETYLKPADMAAMWGIGLCLQAAQIMEQYRLVTGKML